MKFWIRQVEKLRAQVIDFWPIFIAAHLDKRTQKMHVFGTFFMFCNLTLFGLTARPLFLVLAPMGYIPSWLGHLLFEKNIPPTFKANPIVPGLCELKMVGLIMAGELRAELVRLFGQAEPFPGTPLIKPVYFERSYQEFLRFKIRDDIPSHPFEEDYWKIFLMKHQTIGCVSFHVFAMLYLYAILATVVFTGQFHLLALIPLTQIIGLISHGIFERNHIDFEDAIFSPRAFTCLNRMLFLFLTGQYFDEVKKTALILEQAHE